MASRVVPGVSETMHRDESNNLLTNDDLPTLGRPAIATRTVFSGRMVSSTSGSTATNSSSMSATPYPCSADTG